ncbi:hypothetical protein NMY22_g10170 [Coprinellus aureogranulatus]|nr:hypothetical protein NMY22_g10170 [Coprinellus aureogranulatus]
MSASTLLEIESPTPRIPRFTNKHTLNGHSKPIGVLSISADHAYLVSSGDDSLLIVWDLLSGQALQIVKAALHGPIQSALWVYSSRGSCPTGLLFGCADGTVHYYKKEGGSPELVLESVERLSPPCPVEVMAFDPIRALVGIGSAGRCSLWRLTRKGLIPSNSSNARTAMISALFFLDQGRVLVASFLETQEMVAYHTDSFEEAWGRTLRTRIGHAAAAPNGTILVSNLEDGIDVYTIPPVRLLKTIPHEKHDYLLQLCPFTRGALAVAGSRLGRPLVFRTDGTASQTLPYNGPSLISTVASSQLENEYCVVAATLDDPYLIEVCIPWGSAQASEYLLKLIQLKYPSFPTRVTPLQTNWMLRTHCSFTPSYPTFLRSLSPRTLPPDTPHPLSSITRIIQFPYLLPPPTAMLTEEEVAAQMEKRREQGRRLQEIAAEKRREKLENNERDLEELTALREERGEVREKEWFAKLSKAGFDNDAELDDTIKKLDVWVKKARKKEAGDAADEPMEEPSFPLVEIPDEELDEEGLKEKKRQRLLKSGWEFRMRAKKEKEREREEKEAEIRREEEERNEDLEGIANGGRMQWGDRKSAVAQARMKSIAHLAADERVPKKKRKTNGEDTFGADDADWQIYRKINITAPSSDEEEDINNLQAIESKLLQHDPTFTHSHTHASLSSQSSALISAFKPIPSETDIAAHAQIALNTERFRVPQVWFEPGMAGVDTAGLGEVIQNILARFPSPTDKAALAKNIFLTGGPSQIPGLQEKLEIELRPILDPEMQLRIVKAYDASEDAWRGMAGYARTEEFGRDWWGCGDEGGV